MSDANPMSLSFAGCGFNGLYHVGVASCFREYAPLSPNTVICGASAGALAAMALCLKLPLGESTTEILQVAIKARSRALGPFHPSFDVNNIIYDGLSRTLPDDCHKLASGRLHISLTRVSDGKNVIVTQFDTKDDLIRAIQCSCFIPFWSGVFPPKFHGIAYMDGGLSDNLPRIDDNTITVSPFSGEADICPQDESYNPFHIIIGNTSMAFSPRNVYRMFRILFPAHPEELSKICQQGFDDALRFLQRNNKIACTRCLAIQSSFCLEDDIEEDSDYQSQLSEALETLEEEPNHHSTINCTNCEDCQNRRQIANLDSLPESVAQAIQEACDHVNKGLINWLYKHRAMKLLSFLSIPYLLPIDITIAMIVKAWRQLPAVKQHLKSSLFNLVVFLRSIVLKMESKRHLYSAKFSCQLAVTEYDYSHENSPQVYTEPPVRKVSSIRLPKRVLTDTITNSMNPTPTARKSVEKAQSFNAGSRKRSQISAELPPMSTSPEVLAAKAKQRLDRLQQQSKVAKGQRKSYAGFRDLPQSHSLDSEVDRRRSMTDISPKVKPPERVISKLNFGFSFDLKSKSNEEIAMTSESNSPNGVENDENVGDNAVLDALKKLEDIDQTNAVEIANKALEWEREWLQKYKDYGEADGQIPGAEGTNIDKMIELTKKQEALMTFYYTDEKNRVQVTEIFNMIPEEQESADQAAGPNVSEQLNIDDEEDGLRSSPPVMRSALTKPKIAPPTVPPNERRRKKSVMLID